MPDTSGLRPMNFTRTLKDARAFEKAAYADIEQYIETQDADFSNAKVAAYWLEGDHNGDAKYICVLFLIPYAGGGAGVSGYQVYIAMPERLFGAQIDDYLFGGAMTLLRNEQAFIASGSSSGSRFYDLVTFYQGHVPQVCAFDDSQTSYSRVIQL
jgi:hypothetical protein